MNSTRTPAERAAMLNLWSGPVEPRPVGGGITNTNFMVEDHGRRYFVRVGDDIPVHGVMRFNELTASCAAAEVGVSPPVVHAEAGALVLDFIEGRTLEEDDVRKPEVLERIVPLLRRCHDEMARHVAAPALTFWVFHIARHYARLLREAESQHLQYLPELMACADRLETEIGPVDLVFGHNDLLPANFIDDGQRLWLIDWDYAGFNSPLFDLGGLSSNSQFSPDDDAAMLELYYGRSPSGDLPRKLAAMKTASLLRETMWSMVSEAHSTVDFDFAAYTAENRDRLQAAWRAFEEAYG